MQLYGGDMYDATVGVHAEHKSFTRVGADDQMLLASPHERRAAVERRPVLMDCRPGRSVEERTRLTTGYDPPTESAKEVTQAA